MVALTAVDHSSMVDTYANCSTCHTDSGSTVNSGDPKTHDFCSTCHLADGRLTGSAAGTQGAGHGGSDGGGTCFTCHDEYFDSHTNIDHSTSVALDSATSSDIDCIDCHSGAEGDADWVAAELDPSSPAGDKKHDTCSQCHESDGALTGSAAGQDNSTPNGTDGGGDCTVCHGSYFDSHIHHEPGNNNDVTFNVSVDKSQDTLQDPCNSCHKDKTDDAGGCDTCHDYFTRGEKTGDADTPLLATVRNSISSGSPATCVTCHVPKNYTSGATSTHGGHANGDFGWGSDNCIDCHSTTNDYVVKEVHANNCDLCHTGGRCRNICFYLRNLSSTRWRLRRPQLQYLG
jgi:hypothetical protein